MLCAAVVYVSRSREEGFPRILRKERDDQPLRSRSRIVLPSASYMGVVWWYDSIAERTPGVT
jgi:hypothetical protein